MRRLFMIRASKYLCVCALPVFCGLTAAQAVVKPVPTEMQLTTVRVGAVSIDLPSPANDLADPGPDYRVLFEPLAAGPNRLVAAFVPRDNLAAIHAGNAPPMDKYILLEVQRRAEFAAVDPATFRQIAEATAKQLGGDLSQTDRENQDRINQNLKSLGNPANVSIDKPVQLGTFFSEPDAVGFGMITPYNENGVTTRRVGCLAFLRVRGRILSAFTYATYKDESTVNWVKTTSAQWAEAILKANQEPNSLNH
jgi:hypothetical protein